MDHRRGMVPSTFGPIKPHMPYRRCSNFIIELLPRNWSFKKDDVKILISQCKCTPDDFKVYDGGAIAGVLCFQQWTDTLETIVQLWESRLQGCHTFLPSLVQNVVVDSDVDELKDQLKSLFAKHVNGLMEGQLVNKWQQKLKVVLDDIRRVSDSLKKPKPLYDIQKFLEKQVGLNSEKDLILARVEEFKSAMNCILLHLEGKASEDYSMEAFRFGEDFDWNRLHLLLLRECRRLDDGLPIYAFRRGILRQILQQQIMVLIGETGSGKSTQLVQFLADSGVVGTKSIVCTQPRKLAAISLAHRVREESFGCYQGSSIMCYPAYTSDQQFDSKLIYMTDHCLLQHYMKNKSLSGVSCIIVDEAHERSLNTDLLLALLKDLLLQRADLRLVIMSATADANQLSDYFFSCGTFHVVGRKFEVDVRYAPSVLEGSTGSCLVAPYVSDVLKMVTEIHRTEKEGTILAFLTSQMEVEWACEKFQVSSSVALPLHGKLSHEDQMRVFLNYPGKRKVIFSTNLAETSLTIPGVKFVVDSGLVKECRFEPGSGMNVLRVRRISRSSADQRAGRAGRTESGRCYRLYSETDFQLLPLHQEPEIRRVHLGVAVLRILALGVKNVQDFDFIDAPRAEAIEMAIRNLVQLGALTLQNGVYELTKDGWYMVRLAIEPRLGKIILKCFDHRLGREGLVLAAVMANANSIFCRVGTEEDKLKSDRLKVQFCHPSGDLFTLLSVYKEWEGLPLNKRKKWCWDNMINAKSMSRCQEMFQELESCLGKELNISIPTNWFWNPHVQSDHDRTLKNVILSSLAENVAMYTGYDQLGFEVALTGKNVQLHPSCSLLIFSQRPRWVVFGEILSISREYLFCVTTFDFDSLLTLCPPPLFDAIGMDEKKLLMKVLTGFGCILLKKFCGKANNSLHYLVSRIRRTCMDDRIHVEVKVNQNEVLLFASSRDMEKVSRFVNEGLECERRWLQNECFEKHLYLGGPRVSSSVALFGAGAEIKHLELEKRCLTVGIFHSDLNAVNDKELLMFLERNTSGSICAVHKVTGSGQISEEKEKEKWGEITFLTPGAAKKAIEFNQGEFNGALLKVIPAQSSPYVDHKMFLFPAVRAKVFWPRRFSKGIAIVKCETPLDVGFVIDDFSNVRIGGQYIRCVASTKYRDSLVVSGLDRELSEAEIFEVLRTETNRKILDFFVVRGDAVENPPCGACEEALIRELSPLMPSRNSQGNHFHVEVVLPEPKDAFMRAWITFDGSLHLEAAKALEQIDGKVLPGCLSWQKIKCQQLFHSSVFCPASVYSVIEKQLDSLVEILQRQKGAECKLHMNKNGSCRVKISANATRTVAEMRRPLEQLMKGKTIDHKSISPTILQLLFSREGITLMTLIQRQTGTCILFDRQSFSLRVFGASHKIDMAQQRLVESLIMLHESKLLEVHLRGKSLPPDLMKKVVEKFGPDLHGLREKVLDTEFTLNTKQHIISIRGKKEAKQKVEDIIFEIVRASDPPTRMNNNEATCPICLCEVEDGYRLESCGHKFCRFCLVEQCESAMKSRDSFPVRCAYEGCGVLIWLADLRSLMSIEQLEELFRASLGSFVAASGGTYRFCPSPDCSSVYRVADPGTAGMPFMCGSCYVETCTRCHLEYHPFLSCERYKEFKDDPDSSLKEWRKGKEHVKNCPLCGFTIEKGDGCNHIECRCGRHICWVCLEFFGSSDDCYSHLRSVHHAII